MVDLLAMAGPCTLSDRLAHSAEERAEQAEEALRRIVVALTDTPFAPMPRLSELDRVVLAIACDGLEMDDPYLGGAIEG
jgi:hypothetical protein